MLTREDWMMLLAVDDETRAAIRELSPKLQEKCVLLVELGVVLTLEHVLHMRELKNGVQVDNFARTLIFSA